MGYGLVAIPQWLAVLAKDERLIQALYAQAVQGNDARLKSKYELTDTFNACKNIPLSSMDVSAREKMRESAEFLGVYWNSRRSDDDSFHSISNGDEDPVEKEESGFIAHGIMSAF
ncbi:mitogen-activated protein kinase kinase [Perkinsus chesapeaki]|uniref:Mitogen-activated protein kinase kinase n=1 Tax=Perkinsus chesapeaki TaxID=330153 RepID=A0A7J6ML32_PERCH|nr:mitogen-activated protein kinase kinase [Perkinsus chesapeaki]